MTDKTIPFSLLDLAPIPEVQRREKRSPTLWTWLVWLKSAAIIATGWRNITI